MTTETKEPAEREQLMKKVYNEALKSKSSKIQDMVLILFYLLLSDSIATIGPQFVAPVYGNYLSEYYNFIIVASILQIGYLMGKKLRKIRKDDVLKVHFTIGPILLMVSPLMSTFTFIFSDKLGPKLGPIVSLLPFYLVLLNLSVSKFCHHKPPLVEIPLTTYCIFRSFNISKSSLNSLLSPCNTISVLFILWSLSEVFSYYSQYKSSKVKLPSYLKPWNKIKHVMLIYSFIGVVLTHTNGPLQCCWFRKLKVSIFAFM